MSSIFMPKKKQKTKTDTDLGLCNNFPLQSYDTEWVKSFHQFL